jgi:ABC-type transport system involved in multi-copper enzyme maturation permease subunit
MPDMNDSLRRTLWISRVTFLEAVRQRFFAFLLVLGAAMVLSSVSLRVFDFGHGELKFIADFGFGGMFFFGSVLAVVMTAQLFFSEIDNKTALTLLAKPLSRAEFLLGKFFGAWAVLGVFIVVLAGLQGIVLWAREQELIALAEQSGKIPATFSVVGLGQLVLMQWLRLGVVIAIVLAISALARTFLFAVVVGSLAVVAGQLQWIAQDAFLRPTDSPVYAAFLWVSTRLIPNLQQFNLADALVLGSSAVEDGALIAVGLSGLAYLVAYLTVGALIFRRREI